MKKKRIKENEIKRISGICVCDDGKKFVTVNKTTKQKKKKRKRKICSQEHIVILLITSLTAA